MSWIFAAGVDVKIKLKGSLALKTGNEANEGVKAPQAHLKEEMNRWRSGVIAQKLGMRVYNDGRDAVPRTRPCVWKTAGSLAKRTDKRRMATLLVQARCRACAQGQDTSKACVATFARQCRAQGQSGRVPCELGQFD